MNCHYHEFGGSSSGGGSRGNRAMSEIAIAHDMNQPLSTSYHYSSSATPQEIQKKQYKAEMAKATAITKQYSHIISSSPPPANKTTTSTYTNANQQSPPSTTRPNLRPRRTSAEPGGLALSGSFRSKSLSSLASSTDDNNNGSTTQAIGNGSDHSHAGDEVAAAAAATTPPPLKTDVTDLLLTPKLSPPAQDPSMPTNGNNMTPPEWNAQVTDIVSNPPLKMPAKKPPSTRSLHSQQQERRQRHSFQLAPAAADPTSYQQQPQPRRVSDSMALNYSTNSAFQSGTYNSASSPARRRLSPVYNIHDSTPQQRRPSGTLALEEQARMLSQMQQSQPQHAPTKVNSETLAFEEQARMLSQMQQQQQQSQHAPIKVNNEMLAFEEQARMLSQLQQQQQQQQQQQHSPVKVNNETLAFEEQARMLSQMQLQQPQQAPVKVNNNTLAFEEQVRVLTQMQLQQPQHAPVKVNNETLAVEEQARMLSQMQQSQPQHTPVKVNNNTPAFEEQARMLSQMQLQQPQPHPTKMQHSDNDEQAHAILEQEKLWRELSASRRSVETDTTSATSSVASSPVLSPREEQARLWEKIQLEHSQASLMGHSSFHRMDPSNLSSYERGYASMSNISSPIEEQARLLESFQRSRSPAVTTTSGNNSLSGTSQGQERMLRAITSPSHPNSRGSSQSPPTREEPVCPLQEQANRLREIQDEKEKRIVEMACQISSRALALPPSPSPDEEMSLELVMELSRQEAEEAQAKAELADEQALQVALSHSRGETMLVGPPAATVTAEVVVENAPVVASLVVDGTLVEEDQQQQQPQQGDLALQRSMAELACQNSDPSLGEQRKQPTSRLSFPTPTNRKPRRRLLALPRFIVGKK